MGHHHESRHNNNNPLRREPELFAIRWEKKCASVETKNRSSWCKSNQLLLVCRDEVTWGRPLVELKTEFCHHQHIVERSFYNIYGLWWIRTPPPSNILCTRWLTASRTSWARMLALYKHPHINSYLCDIVWSDAVGLKVAWVLWCVSTNAALRSMHEAERPPRINIMLTKWIRRVSQLDGVKIHYSEAPLSVFRLLFALW